MNERLTLQDLVDLLADKQNIPKKDAELFLRELFSLITETISNRDYVRIKDFGTFKLVAVSARKSVDVNTGEPIEIPPHYKLSFAPEKSFKEYINKPFAHIESVLLDDEDVTDNLETEEIVPEKKVTSPQEQTKEVLTNTTTPIPALPVDQIVATSDEKVDKREETLIEVEEDIQAQNMIEETLRSETKEDLENIDLNLDEDDTLHIIDAHTETHTFTPVTTQSSVEDSANGSEDSNVIQDNSKPESTTSSLTEDSDITDFLQENKTNKTRGIIIALCAIVVVIFAIVFFVKNNSTKVVDSPPDTPIVAAVNEQENTKPEENQLEASTASVGMQDNDLSEQHEAEQQEAERIAKEKEQQEKEQQEKEQQEKNKLETERIAKEKAQAEKKKQEELAAAATQAKTVKLQKGETLQSLAFQYFGNRLFWVYIYQENSSTIKNPDAIFAGMDMKIPNAAKYKINAKDKESLSRASTLQSELFKKFAKK